jgi:hypothetical protein
MSGKTSLVISWFSLFPKVFYSSEYIISHMASFDGEMELLLNDLRTESESMMHELSELEDMLVQLKGAVESGRIEKSKLLASIEEMRKKVGLVEHLDQDEYNIESSLASLVSKFKDVIGKFI